MLTLRKKPILRVIVIPTIIVLTEIANANSALITLLLFEGKTQRTNKLIIVRAESMFRYYLYYLLLISVVRVFDDNITTHFVT